MMNRKFSNQALFGLISFFLYSLNFPVIIFLPIYLHDTLNISIILTGIAISSYGVGAVIASYFGGRLCDNFSSYKISVISLCSYFLFLIILYYVYAPYYLLLILLTLLGAANAVFLPASRIYLMRATQPENQAKANGIRYMLFNIGSAGATGLFGWFIHHTNYKNIFILSAFFAASSLICFLILCHEETVDFIKTTAIKQKIWGNKFFIAVFSYFFLGMIVLTQFNSNYSLFLFNNYFLNIHQISIIYMINSLLIALFQLMILNLFKNTSQVFLMVLGCFILGFGLLILTFSQTYFLSIISVIILTLGEMLFVPISQNIVYQKAADESKGYYMGIYQVFFAVASILGPALGSTALHIDASGKFLWISAFVICSIPLLGYFSFSKRLRNI